MKPGIANTETIKINMPESLARSLLNDAAGFEVFKKDGETVNLNSFISSLIAGYYEKYQEELSERLQKTKTLLASYIRNPDLLNQASMEIVSGDMASENPARKEANSQSIKFRPTRETDGIITEIEEKRRMTHESLSGYFRHMLGSYMQNPIYERERIIYYQNTAAIERACSRGESLVFTCRDNPGFLHTVIPYSLVHGPEELYNYLLCQESNDSSRKKTARSYRLCRIVNPRATPSDKRIDSRVRDCLVRMEKYGPQFMINDDVVTCVRLTADGRKSFQKIYQGRPIVDRKDEEDSDGHVNLYFSCSQEQLFLYFRRFNPGEITILYPQKLKKRLYQFHYDHLKNLE